MESPRVFSYKIPAVWPAGISCISQTRLRSLRPLTPAYTRLRPLTPPGLGHSARRARNPLETRLNKTRRAGRPFLRAQTRGQPKNGTLVRGNSKLKQSKHNKKNLKRQLRKYKFRGINHSVPTV